MWISNLMRSTSSPRKSVMVIVWVALGCCIVTMAWCLTTDDWIAKAQSWVTAHAQGGFVLTSSIYREDGVLVGSGTTYFQGGTNGWSSRTDTTLHFDDTNTLTGVYTVIDTPQGEKAWFEGTCVYPPSSLLSSPYQSQSHSSLPQVIYSGDSSRTAAQALSDISTSASACVGSDNGNPVYELDVTYNIAAANARVNEPSYQMSTNDQWTGSTLIDASTGEPIEYSNNHYISEVGAWERSKLRFTSVDTGSTIPSSTFDLGTDTPTNSLENAIIDFLEAHGY